MWHFPSVEREKAMNMNFGTLEKADELTIADRTFASEVLSLANLPELVAL